MKFIKLGRMITVERRAPSLTLSGKSVEQIF